MEVISMQTPKRKITVNSTSAAKKARIGAVNVEAAGFHEPVSNDAGRFHEPVPNDAGRFHEPVPNDDGRFHEPVPNDDGGEPDVNDNDEDQEMDRLIRSACPDNLQGGKCKQSRCKGLRICPGFNRSEKTCLDSSKCGLLHIRASCQWMVKGEPCQEECDWGHDHQAARIAVWIQRRAQAERNEARKGPGRHEGRRISRQLERAKAQYP
ncbi:MAG: hypothetical protein LQ337_006184 [Flavoplaca oasis]|nr:MAG: hypothetical protein LQ337_006184 [Flavoplaca oasis]